MRRTQSLGMLLPAAGLLLAGCGAQQTTDAVAPRALPEYRAFGAPQRVALRGYAGDAMEPFITRDGRYLLFNNRNDPRVDTQLHYAEFVDATTFDYRGEVQGVSTRALEGVPSLDRQGNLYFVSTRSYDETLATLYHGRFANGAVSGVALVPGVSLARRGMLIFDAEVSGDGATLFVVDGRFSGGAMPDTADIDIAVRTEAGFRRLPSARDLLRAINTPDLEYAPAISGDLLELFFTRLDRSGSSPRIQILRAARTRVDAPFGEPEHVVAIMGFVEAPTLSSDGRSLYYHQLDNGRYVILRVTR